MINYFKDFAKKKAKKKKNKIKMLCNLFKVPL